MIAITDYDLKVIKFL